MDFNFSDIKDSVERIEFERLLMEGKPSGEWSLFGFGEGVEFVPIVAFSPSFAIFPMRPDSEEWLFSIERGLVKGPDGIERAARLVYETEPTWLKEALAKITR